MNKSFKLKKWFLLSIIVMNSADKMNLYFDNSPDPFIF